MSDYPDLSSSFLFGGFKGKVAVVSGGGSGIGTMIATAFVQNGAKVYISSRKEKQLKETADVLNKMGPGSCEYIVADLSNKAGCDKLVNEIKAKENKIHVLVNNSGMSWGAPIDNFPEKEGWDRLFALNVKSIFYMTVGLSDLLAKDATNHSPGVVLNMSSVAGINPVAESGRLSANNSSVYSYNASKAAVNHLTSSLAVTFAKRFVTVNAICPGVFPSKMTAFGVKKAGGVEAMGRDNPFKRIGEPRDMAGLALFLSSTAGAYITGAHIALDGGATLSRGADMLGGSQPKL